MALDKPRLLRPTDQLDDFCCGDAELDDWLARIAPMAQSGRTARVYVTTDGSQVAGYYALAAGQVLRADLPARIGRGAPSPGPVAILARLAVDRRHQGRGLGIALLSDAARRVLEAAEIRTSLPSEGTSSVMRNRRYQPSGAASALAGMRAVIRTASGPCPENGSASLRGTAPSM